MVDIGLPGFPTNSASASKPTASTHQTPALTAIMKKKRNSVTASMNYGIMQTGTGIHRMEEVNYSGTGVPIMAGP